MNMKNILMIFLAIPFFISSQNFVVVDSENASYDGRDLVLTGDVLIEHEIGKLQAGYVKFCENGQNEIHLKNSVVFDFDPYRQLSCQSAVINIDHLKGIFLGDEKQKYVIYSETYPGGKPLSVKSQQIGASLSKDKKSLTQMTAKDDVVVQYDGTVVSADQGVYKPLYDAAVRGCKIILSQNGEMTNSKGDRILADQIEIDTGAQAVSYKNTKGKLKSLHNKGVDFSADSLFWDEKKALLTLREDIYIKYPQIGSLKTDQEMIVTHEIVDNKKKIQSICCKGKTLFTFDPDDSELNCFSIKCHENFIVDVQKGEIRIDTPKDYRGEYAHDKQIKYNDDMGEILADRLKIGFEIKDKVLHATHVSLDGNVKIMNRYPFYQESSEEALQYALADRVDYHPTSKEMIISCLAGKRVLFMDELNNVEISAPAVKLKRDLTSNENRIQGLGRVRFSFLEEETMRLKQQFMLGKKDEK